MRKVNIPDHVARDGGMTKRAAETAVGTVFVSVAAAPARGEDVKAAGFGRFALNSRPAREDRSPATGERTAFGPSSGVSFKAAKALKDALI